MLTATGLRGSFSDFNVPQKAQREDQEEFKVKVLAKVRRELMSPGATRSRHVSAAASSGARKTEIMSPREARAHSVGGDSVEVLDFCPAREAERIEARNIRILNAILSDKGLNEDILVQDIKNLTDAEFESILIDAQKEIERIRWRTGDATNTAVLIIVVALALAAIYFSSFNLTGLIPFEGTAADFIKGIALYLLAGIFSTGGMYMASFVHALQVCKKIALNVTSCKKLRANCKKLGMNAISCGTKFYRKPACAKIIDIAKGVLGFIGVGSLLTFSAATIWKAPRLDAKGSEFGYLSLKTFGNPENATALDHQIAEVHYYGTYGFESAVPAVFIFGIWGGIFSEILGGLYGEKGPNKKVDDATYMLRAPLLKLLQSNKNRGAAISRIRTFVKELMSSKDVNRNEFMHVVDFLNVMEYRAQDLDSRGLNRERLYVEDCTPEDVDTFLKLAVDRASGHIKTLARSLDSLSNVLTELIENSVFRNKVLAGLKCDYENSRYNDTAERCKSWFKLLGVRVPLLWFSPNTLVGVYASPIIVSAVKKAVGIPASQPFNCSALGNNTISEAYPYSEALEDAFSYGGQGFSFCDAIMNTITSSLMMAAGFYYTGCSLPRFWKKMTVPGVKGVVAPLLGALGSSTYLYVAFLSGKKYDAFLDMRDCPNVIMPEIPLLFQYRGSNHVAVVVLGFILYKASSDAWLKILTLIDRERHVRSRGAAEMNAVSTSVGSSLVRLATLDEVDDDGVIEAAGPSTSGLQQIVDVSSRTIPPVADAESLSDDDQTAVHRTATAELRKIINECEDYNASNDEHEFMLLKPVSIPVDGEETSTA